MADKATIASSSYLASDTSTISNDFEQGVGRTMYGIMRSAGTRVEGLLDRLTLTKSRSVTAGEQNRSQRELFSFWIDESESRHVHVNMFPSGPKPPVISPPSLATHLEKNLPPTPISHGYERIRENPFLGDQEGPNFVDPEGYLSFTNVAEPNHTDLEDFREEESDYILSQYSNIKPTFLVSEPLSVKLPIKASPSVEEPMVAPAKPASPPMLLLREGLTNGDGGVPSFQSNDSAMDTNTESGSSTGLTPIWEKQQAVRSDGEDGYDTQIPQQHVNAMSEDEIEDAIIRLTSREDPKHHFLPLWALRQKDSRHLHVARVRNTQKRVVVEQTDLFDGDLKKVVVNELFLLKDASHPNIINILQAHYFKAGQLWVIKEYFDGYALSELRRCHGAFSEPPISLISLELCNALSFLHKRRIVHGDLRLDNIILNTSGKVKVTDLGSCGTLLSSSVGLRASQARNALIRERTRTRPYSTAPELAIDLPYDEKVDIWSLGIIALEMGGKGLTYDRSEPLKALDQITNKEIPQLRPYLCSEDMGDFLSHCLDAKPVNRWAADILVQSEPFLQHSCSLSKLEDLFDLHEVNLLDISPRHISEQLTLLGNTCFKRINGQQLIEAICEGKPTNDAVRKFEQMNEEIVEWVVQSILFWDTYDLRANMVNFWVPIAHHCWKNSNLAVLQAIISALQRPSIRQLKSMWNQVTNTTQDLFMRYQVMMDPRNNFQICRGLLRTLETEAHVIPSIDILKAWLNGLSADSREAADMLEQLKYWQADKHPFTVNRFLQQLIQEQLDEARQKASDRDALISLEP